MRLSADGRAHLSPFDPSRNEDTPHPFAPSRVRHGHDDSLAAKPSLPPVLPSKVAAFAVIHEAAGRLLVVR